MAQASPIRLYDLAGREDHRFSPACWRAKLALAHKGLDVETVPTRFTDIARIGDGGFKTVPVLEHGDNRIVDSRSIAEYLEATWPDRPSLFGGEGGRALTGFIEAWMTATVQARIGPCIIRDIFDHLDPADQAYFRESREARYGATLEAVQAGRDDRIDELRQSLEPLRRLLAIQPFLGGDGPLYADYVVLGAFQWARATSPYRILAEDDPLRLYLDRLLDLHDGLARNLDAYLF